MMWKDAFAKGVASYKKSQFSDALTHFDEAITLGCDQFSIYDSRAAVYEKIGNFKAALRDSKKVIDLAPERWQGYARSARLFHQLEKHEAVVRMADLALERVKSDDIQRRADLCGLKKQAIDAQAALEHRRIANSTYHIGKLPVELFTSIFLLVLEEDAARVVTLSHVCRHWRNITIATPCLWRTLVISDKHPVRKVQTWIQRSKSHIFALIFRPSTPELDSPAIFTALTPLSWNSLQVCKASGRWLMSLHHILGQLSMLQAISNLEELDLIDCSAIDDVVEHFQNSKLRTLTLGGTTSLNSSSWQHIRSLVSLTIRANHAGNDILGALQMNPMLESFILDHTQPVSLTGNLRPPVSMPHLKHLELRNLLSPRSVLVSAHAPSLRILRIFNAPMSVDESLAQMTDVGVDNLVELSIGSSPVTSRTLRALLLKASLLETLQISSIHGVVNDVLEALSKPERTTGELLCPSLKHVDISRTADVQTGIVMGLVKSRMHAGGEEGTAGTLAGVETLRMDGCPKIDAEVLPWLRTKVKLVSCVYMSRKEARAARR
ncbi:hypothetical protein BV22DRAFT_1088860 [Leucogyrophana mollusca]|uniref:Uncharacterized protein n=1 Tax=Leucogyrophana mollusca TaxID=85980 RepID=A0ACB8BIY3_9AGAM|nr:hypothetical protein BV22DRAFT_1088860 [Leucogyrophana mollusca]